MRGRGQLVAAVLVVAFAATAAIGLQREVGPRALAASPRARAPSGAWFCPHGGGDGWQATLEVANPGDRPVRIRVTELSEERPAAPKTYTVGPRAELPLPEPTPSRASSSMIEYFDGWVAAGWVSHAGGGEAGVAAEPCAAVAGSDWLLPDGSTQLAEGVSGPRSQRALDSYVVVMNPFAADAVFSLTLYTDRDAPVRPGKWTNVPLKPFRARAFHLNDQRLGYATVSTGVQAKVGRVVASSLDVTAVGGIRSSLGQLEPLPSGGVLPGALDQGRTDLVVMNTTSHEVQATGTVLGGAEPAPLGGSDQGKVNADSAQTFPVTTDGPSGLDVRVPAGAAVVRRTYGKVADQAAIEPAVPRSAWVVLPAIAGGPSHAGMVVVNPGPQPIKVLLSPLSFGSKPPPQPITLTVPGLRSAAVPAAFVQARPLSAILAMSSDGAFVPAAASYSLGQDGYAGYATSLGVPIPDDWVPR